MCDYKAEKLFYAYPPINWRLINKEQHGDEVWLAQECFQEPCSFGCFSSRVFSIHIFLLITHTSGSEARSLFECTRRRSPNFSQFPLKTSNRSSTSSFEKGGNKQAWDELCPHQVAWWVSSNDSETSHLRTPYSTISQGRNLESKGIDIVILRRPTLAHTSWKWEWSRAKSV